MSLVSSDSIKSPKLEITPPNWAKFFTGFVLLLVYTALFFIPLDSAALKIAILVIYGVVLLGIVGKVLKGNYLVTVQVNRDGVYFQSDKAGNYFFVPWRCVGTIEKALFPLGKRGLRFEVIGEYKNIVRKTGFIGNVMADGEQIFIYTLPQLNNRDRLIKKILYYREPIFKY